MVEESITDGYRIAELLSSEVTGLERDAIDELSVVDADPDVEPSDDGAFAYGIDHGETRLADVYVQPDRAYLEVRASVDAAKDAAAAVGLRVRPKATTPPRTLVFVEQGAFVKRALDVLVAAAEAESDEE
jgi:hypothetical protein